MFKKKNITEVLAEIEAIELIVKLTDAMSLSERQRLKKLYKEKSIIESSKTQP